MSTMELIGGLGLFLLGMIVMTDGLRSIAGESVRAWLIRFTHTPLSGALSGAACTAFLQSSSATTVAAVGFVAANLISFPAALGLIIGANLGTTITGWMVALLGFKIKLGVVALPLLFVGSVLRLFSSGRLAGVGFTVAGFALIFIGISTMQEAMVNFRGLFVFERWSGESLSDRFVLIGIGAAFTIIAQSSSAGVATTLTALHSGVVTFPQAAALVIGMDVGTTVTALVAATGASVNARRTGLSHVIYNLMTGLAAVLLIPVYIAALPILFPDVFSNNAEFALVGFHSLFNALGVIAVLPFTRKFARLMERVVPSDLPPYTKSLDPVLIVEPDLALNAVNASVKLEFRALLQCTRGLLDEREKVPPSGLAELRIALEETHAYLDRIHLKSGVSPNWQRLVAALHAVDHSRRLHDRCDERLDLSLLKTLPSELVALKQLLLNGITAIEAAFSRQELSAAATAAGLMRTQTEANAIDYREAVIDHIAEGAVGAREGTELLDITRWFQRVSQHIERATQYIDDSNREHNR